MIDPLFIMRNVKLKLYCPGNLKINLSAHKRPICSLVEYVTTRKYDLKLRWWTNNKTQNSSIKILYDDFFSHPNNKRSLTKPRSTQHKKSRTTQKKEKNKK